MTMNETLKPIRTAGVSDYTPTDQIVMTIENSRMYCFGSMNGWYAQNPIGWLDDDKILSVIVGKGRPEVGLIKRFFSVQPSNPRIVLGCFHFDQIQGKTVPFYLSCPSVQPQAQAMLEYIQSQCPDLDFVIRMNWPMSPNEEVYYSCE